MEQICSFIYFYYESSKKAFTIGYLLSFPKERAVSFTPGADCLLLYSEKCKEEYELSDNEHKKLQKLLISAVNKNKFSKISEINYDKDNGNITEIKVLQFNEDTRTFNLKFQENKSKPKSGSKSNIERLLKQ